MITIYIIAAILGIALATIWFFIDKHSYYEDYEPFTRFMARMIIPTGCFTIAMLLTSLIIGFNDWWNYCPYHYISINKNRNTTKYFYVKTRQCRVNQVL